MDVTLLETLFNKTESETLDFKEKQYRFSGASDEDKSELLKDVLAFANAWKDTDAYIIVGVRECNGRVESLPGVDSHLADSDVQQFVNEETNKPVLLSVYAVKHEQVELDVIRIVRAQERPIYSKRNYGKLKERTVYIRRGSSTAIADPDEISAIGRSQAISALAPVPTITVEFGDPDKRARFGTVYKIISTELAAPSPKPTTRNPVGSITWDGESWDTIRVQTHDPLRPSHEDCKRYLDQSAFFQPLGFWVNNTGTVNIRNSKIEVRIPRVAGLRAVSRGEGPKKPAYGFRTDFSHMHESLSLIEEPEQFLATFEYARIQPKAECWSPGLFYIGGTQSVTCECKVSVFADDLTNPITSVLWLQVETAQREYPLAEFFDLIEETSDFAD